MTTWTSVGTLFTQFAATVPATTFNMDLVFTVVSAGGTGQLGDVAGAILAQPDPPIRCRARSWARAFRVLWPACLACGAGGGAKRHCLLMADEKCRAVSAAGRVAQLFWCSLFSVEGVPRACAPCARWDRAAVPASRIVRIAATRCSWTASIAQPTAASAQAQENSRAPLGAIVMTMIKPCDAAARVCERSATEPLPQSARQCSVTLGLYGSLKEPRQDGMRLATHCGGLIF